MTVMTNLLAKSCDGLIYVSETDAPVTVFVGSPVSNFSDDTILAQIGADSHQETEVVELRDFFCRLTTIKDWYGEREKQRAKKFLDLQKLIEEHLSDAKVYRLGQTSKHIYIIGLGPESRLIGVKTLAVET